MRRKIIALIAMVVLSSPMFAQTSAADNASTTATPNTNMSTQQSGENHHDYGWLGLIGLAGLAGLGGRKRNDNHTIDNRTNAR